MDVKPLGHDPAQAGGSLPWASSVRATAAWSSMACRAATALMGWSVCAAREVTTRSRTEPDGVAVRKLSCVEGGRGHRGCRLMSKDEVTEMHHFQCGHEECGSQFTMSHRDDLMRQVAQHLKDEHGVNSATETLMSYLESTCVTVRQS